MEAGTLKCPTCGAAISGDSTSCRYCGAKLATVACPSCFGMAFVGSKFCPHCGAELAWAAEHVTLKLSCPRCKVGLGEKQIGEIVLWECGGCCGLWVTAKTFDRICREREEQAAVLGEPVPADPGSDVNMRGYIPCPLCHQLMNRTQFAYHSGVVIDVCRKHGVWFDRDELRKIVEFIRAGGLDRARDHELETLEAERRRIEALNSARLLDGQSLNAIASTGGVSGMIIW